MFRQAQSNSTARVSASPRRWRRTRSKPPARWSAVLVIMAAWGRGSAASLPCRKVLGWCQCQGHSVAGNRRDGGSRRRNLPGRKAALPAARRCLAAAAGGLFRGAVEPCSSRPAALGIRRRGMAVFVVTLLAVLLFAGLAAAFGFPLSRGITHLAHAMPGYVARAEHGRGWTGHLVRQYHVAAWVRRNESKLIRFGQDGSAALTVGKGAVSLLAALATLFVLVVLLLLEGPELMEGLLGAMTPAHTPKVLPDCRRGQPRGHRLHGRQLPDLADRRRRRVRHPGNPGGAVPVSVGAVGSAGRFPADRSAVRSQAYRRCCSLRPIR